LADIVDGEDVRMVERGGGAGFLLEALEAPRIGRESGGQDFDGDVTPQPGIVRAVDLSHPAGAERGADLIGAEADARREGHVRK
jgi:hypothetical protein